ncbi:MAG: magnesium transporter [Alphaproteobacteria bacterium]|nr:magnesium transporter [Alphaproteobacteria bacterium]
MSPTALETVSVLLEQWSSLPMDERVGAFRALPVGADDDLFFALSIGDQAELILALPPEQRKVWVRALPPDDIADLVQYADEEDRPGLLAQLDEPTRREVRALLAYEEDAAGGLMSPRFARLRSDMTVGEAIRYLRRQAQAQLEMIYYAYVLDPSQRLVGVVSFRDLFATTDDRPVAEIMRRDPLTVPPNLDQEQVARVFARHDLAAVPVVDDAGMMQGIITIDDIVDVVQEEASEDMQKLGGMEALDLPYLDTDLVTMIRKRAGWLALLFVGELLTATAMASYEDEIAKAVVLAVFVPLIISSGGNSGSQAATLLIRALALGEVRPRDWLVVLRREIASGLALGGLLGVMGMLRVLAWQQAFGTYGDHAFLVGLTVAISLVGVVIWGTVSGAILPLVIQRVGLDPASASTPFVATLVDVTGLVIYFSVAHALLTGTLL